MSDDKTRSPLDVTLSWTTQRRIWNREGFCAREACTLRHANLVHRDSRLLYCTSCADKINKANCDLAPQGLVRPKAGP